MWVALPGLSNALTFVNSFGSHVVCETNEGRLSLFIDKEMEAQRSEMNFSRTYSSGAETWELLLEPSAV